MTRGPHVFGVHRRAQLTPERMAAVLAAELRQPRNARGPSTPEAFFWQLFREASSRPA